MAQGYILTELPPAEGISRTTQRYTDLGNFQLEKRIGLIGVIFYML